MKISLIQPYYHNIWEALGPAYLAAYCKANGDAHEFDFYQGYFDSDDVILNGVKDSDIVGFSCTSPTYKPADILAKKIKEINPNITTVMGGFHPTSLPLLENKYIDHMVRGEGEQAFLDIVNGKQHKDKQLFKFDQLPWPDRDVIRNERPIDLCEEVTGQRMTSFQAHRGCLFACKYCAETAMTGNNVRARSIDDVLDEIEHVNDKYKLDLFKFVDPMFDTNIDYVKEFSKRKIERKIETPWECLFHARFSDEEMFRLMGESNCNQIDVGVETGSPKLLKAMRKGVKTPKIIETFDLARKHGIKRRAFIIIGMPEETEDDVYLTEKLIDRIDPDVFAVTLLCPYPGSDYYRPEFENVDWSKTDEYSNDFWRTENFTNGELKHWQNYLMDDDRSINKDRIKGSVIPQ